MKVPNISGSRVIYVTWGNFWFLKASNKNTGKANQGLQAIRIDGVVDDPSLFARDLFRFHLKFRKESKFNWKHSASRWRLFEYNSLVSLLTKWWRFSCSPAFFTRVLKAGTQKCQDSFLQQFWPWFSGKNGQIIDCLFYSFHFLQVWRWSKTPLAFRVQFSTPRVVLDTFDTMAIPKCMPYTPQYPTWMFSINDYGCVEKLNVSLDGGTLQIWKLQFSCFLGCKESKRVGPILYAQKFTTNKWWTLWVPRFFLQEPEFIPGKQSQDRCLTWPSMVA